MSSRRVVCAGLAAGALFGCGFQPIATPSTVGISSIGVQDARLPLRAVGVSVDIDSDAKRFEYLLRQALDRSIATGVSVDDGLDITVVIEREGLAIEQNDSVTRYNLTATADYELQSASGDVVLDKKTVSITAVNATASQFSTAVSQRDALRRIANDLANRIIVQLRLHYSTVALNQ